MAQTDLIEKVTKIPGIHAPTQLDLTKSFAGKRRVFFVKGYWWDQIRRPVSNSTGQPVKTHGKWAFVRLPEQMDGDDVIVEIGWANRIIGRILPIEAGLEPHKALSSGQKALLQHPVD